MGLPARVSERFRNLRLEWRAWIEPRNVSVVIAVAGVLVLALGAVLIEPARERLPALSREPVRLFTGTMSRARDVFIPDRDDDDQQLLTTAGAPDGPNAARVGLRPDEPVARLAGRTGTLTVAEVERLVREDPDRADDLVFLPGVTVREATALLERRPRRDQVPAVSAGSPTSSPGSSTTSRPTGAPSTTAPSPRPGPGPGPGPASSARPWYQPFVPRPSEPAPAPSTTVPETTVPATTVPETTVPATTEPDTTVPATTVPVTTVPETTVPDTTVPETTLPATTVPEATSVPASVPPESTTLPDSTTAPEVDFPPDLVVPDLSIPDLVL